MNSVRTFPGAPSASVTLFVCVHCPMRGKGAGVKTSAGVPYLKSTKEVFPISEVAEEEPYDQTASVSIEVSPVPDQ